MKTLYEILEVSENASKEIIEKAYKVLAKKYHPDLQPEGQKENAEQIMKQINEAYNVLINETKRKSYDAKFNEENENIQHQNMQEEIIKQRKMQQEIQKDIKEQYEQKYQEAYEGYLKSLGYKIKYKWTWKNYRDFFITILTIIIICAVLWIFPPTNKIIMNFYESNTLIKTIVQVIGKILVGIWNGICSIFTKTSNP